MNVATLTIGESEILEAIKSFVENAGWKVIDGSLKIVYNPGCSDQRDYIASSISATVGVGVDNSTRRISVRERNLDECGPCFNGNHSSCYEPCICKDNGHAQR